MTSSKQSAHLSASQAPNEHREDDVCLLIPYYESPAGLLQSLASVQLNSSDVIIVVDDGSARHPAASCCPAKVYRTPIRLVVLEENRGIAGALRAGMAEVPESVQYVARLDCGDTCQPDRFTRQLEHLRNNPQCAIVGCWVDFVNPGGEVLYTQIYPVSDQQIRNYMRVNSAFTHPAVMFRKSAYHHAGGYLDAYPAAEDYALFREILRHHQGANIAEVLVACTTSDGGISETSRRRQIRTRIKIMVEHFDGHPMAIYGILRAILQLATPRRLTTVVKQTLQRARAHHLDGDSAAKRR